MTHPMSSADIIILYQKSTTFVILRNTDKDCILMHNFYFFSFFFESLKGCSDKNGCNFDDVNKTGYYRPSYNKDNLK